MEVVKVENVTRIYKVGAVETRALQGVNLSIESGEFTTLVGPSGSGKTTLLQMIGCLDQPTSGRVFVDGKDVTTLNRNQRADMRKGHIGFVFQFFALIPTLSAYENVEMPLLLTNHGSSERRERVMHLLEPPSHLFHPSVMRKVLVAALSRCRSDPAPRPRSPVAPGI